MDRSYWIPGSYAPILFEKHNAFLRLLKKKGFKEESMTKIGLYAIGKSKTLESNKSHLRLVSRVSQTYGKYESQRGSTMQCKGIVQGNVVILEEGIYLPDGMHVTVTVAQEEQQAPGEVTDEELAQRRALGEQMKAFGQRLAGRS